MCYIAFAVAAAGWELGRLGTTSALFAESSKPRPTCSATSFLY
jgi:hypothetical protein